MRWIVGILLATLALAGVGFWRAHSIANATIERHLVSYRRTVERLRATPLSRPALLEPTEAGNAQEIYDALHAALATISDSDLDQATGAEADDPNAFDARAVRTVLGPALASMIAMDRAWYRGWVSSFPADLGSTPDPGSADVHRVTKAYRGLAAAIVLARAEGRHADALPLATSLALLGQDAGRGGTLLSLAVALNGGSGAVFSLMDLLRDSPFSEAELAPLAARLSKLRVSKPAIEPVWPVEIALLAGLLADDAQFAMRPSGAIPGRGERLLTWASLYSIRIARSNALRALERLPDQLPAVFGTEPWDTAAERLLDAHEISPHDPLLTEYLILWPFVLGKHRNRDVELAVLELAVAVARFEAATGKWPVSASELVPTYLTAIPSSPYDPEGVRWEGNEVWSRGPDGDDDGRRPRERTTVSSDGDIVVVLKGHR